MERNTRQRELIRSIIVGKKVHLSASDVFSLLQEKGENVSLATVYRTLNALAFENEIASFLSFNNETIYDGNITPHSHMICEKCGKISDVNVDELNIIETIENKYGGKIKQINVTLLGICDTCIQKEIH